MKRHSALDYAYSVGRVRALETVLIDKSLFLETAAAPDVSSSLKRLAEAGRFPESFLNIRTAEDVDRIIDGEAVRLASLLSFLLLDKDILEIFLMDDRPGEALAVAERFGGGFVKNYLRHRIDLGNMKFFLRSKFLELPQERLRSALPGGGFIEESVFYESYVRPAAEFGEELSSTPYRDLWDAAVRALEERETFIVLEKGIENFLMDYLKSAKLMVFGPEPVFAYGLAKKRELGLVRMIVTGKLLRVPAAVLQERIGETYV